MKKYIRPDVQIVKFDVESSVMTAPGAIMANDPGAMALSTANNYIPDNVDNKVWTEYGDENWTWEE